MLLEAGSTRSAVNRSYYAAFYAVLALLETSHQVPRKHQGAIGLFDSEFVRKGLLPVECSKWLHRLFEARQRDDYQSLSPVDPQDARLCLEQAAGFVAALREFLTTSAVLER